MDLCFKNLKNNSLARFIIKKLISFFLIYISIIEQKTNMSTSSNYLPSNYLPSNFTNQLLKKIRDSQRLKEDENDFYNTLPYVSVRVRRHGITNRTHICKKKWYVYNLIRCMRLVYMFLNKNKYKVFTYSSMKFWKIASSKKKQNIEDTENKIKLYDFN